MRILIITAPSRPLGSQEAGQATNLTWSQRIVAHLQTTAPAGWQIVEPPDWPALAYELWSALGTGSTPQTAGLWSAMLDDLEDMLPDCLPNADLLLVLTESTLMTDLVSDLARLCSAQAVIVGIDRRSVAPPGLVGQVRRRLQKMGIDSAWPMPFCSLAPTPGQHPLIREFAQRYGRPELTCTVQNNRIASCQIVREAPCGNTRYIVSHLVGVEASQAAEQCGLLHHYYPCWGGMETDPVHGTHTLLHIAATMALKSVQHALSSASPASVGEIESKGEIDDTTSNPGSP